MTRGVCLCGWFDCAARRALLVHWHCAATATRIENKTGRLACAFFLGGGGGDKGRSKQADGCLMKNVLFGSVGSESEYYASIV